MRRREFLSLLGGAAAASGLLWPFTARTQQAKRIGVLASFEADDPQGQMLIRSFREGLQERGWIEGRNVEIVFRYAQARLDRLPALAAEVVEAKPSVVVTHGTPAVGAVQKAGPSVPIVFATIGDPVSAGIVASLARPGGTSPA